MTSQPIVNWLFALALAVGLIAGAQAGRASAPADGPWRLTIDLSSFFDGHLGSIERVVELRNGTWEGDIREGRMLVGVRVTVAGSAVNGLLAVTAGSNWNSASVPFQAAVVDGVVERQLSVAATYNVYTGFGHRDRQSRYVDIDLRLERL
jgi:hypothetical protein